MPGTIAFIGRAARFSPNSVGKDRAILEAVRQQLLEWGYECTEIVPEEQLDALWPDAFSDSPVESFDGFVSMGRYQDTLNLLGTQERQHTPVVNGTASVMLCNHRTLLMQVLEDAGVAVPPMIGHDGYWVKRGYGCAEGPDDIQYCADWDAACVKRDEMFDRGEVDVEVRAHVEGDVVKFYAVRGTDFFRYYYPSDDGDMKFADQQRQPAAHHYPFDVAALQAMARQAAELIDLDIYGGDCIVRPDGQPVLVDLNDWPSFSRCREEAAQAIAQRIVERMNE